MELVDLEEKPYMVNLQRSQRERRVELRTMPEAASDTRCLLDFSVHFHDCALYTH